ncbi:MAG: spheroidene monooxygenase [Pseudomonadota bacterium]
MTQTTQTTSLSFFRFAGVGARAWALTQMAFARPAMARLPHAGFWKLFGSGTGEGFTPLPNTAVYGIMATWESADLARRTVETAPVFARYRKRAAEHWTVYLQTTSSRGAWDGRDPFTIAGNARPGALAALTRATIKPKIMMQFWRRVPSISAAIGADPNVAFKIGLGEIPWFHQVTFSIWPDTQAMAAFARRDGPHAHAIRAVREGQWFAEELYARFQIVGASGTWEGGCPLAHLEEAHPA